MAVGGLGQIQEEDGGDFFERCFPKTFAHYYATSTNPGETEGHDPFDTFVDSTFPFFRYLIRSYYESKKAWALQFSNLASRNRIEELDESMCRYLITGEETAYRAAEAIFVFALEEYVVNAARDRTQ